MSRFARRLLVALGLLLVALVVQAGVQTALAAKELRHAQGEVNTAATVLADGNLAAAQTSLSRAETDVLDANQRLRTTLGISVARLVPVLRTNIQSVEDSVHLATVVIHGGRRILGASEDLQGPNGTLEVSLSDGTVPLPAVTEAQRELDALSAQLVELKAPGSNPLLLPVVADARDRVTADALERRAQIAVLTQGLGLLRELVGADGPRRYLIAVSNSAEMRGTGGMILNYGVLEGSKGKVTLSDFGRIDDLALTQPVDSKVVPADYLARWDGFDPLLRWRQANLSGDFTLIAPALEAMYEQATALPVNGVIQVDPQGLAAILTGVGPVTVPEVGQVTSKNVVPLVLNQAYVRFPDVEKRADVLGDVAEATFKRLVTGKFPSLRPLATAITGAVDGRHLIVSATAAVPQAAIVGFGADGSYPALDDGDSFALTAQNLAGNKLDYYLDTGVTLAGTREADAAGEIEATVVLHNTAPAGSTTPRYVFGPGPGPTARPAGELRSLVTLYLPVGTTLGDVGGDRTVEKASTGTEGGRAYATFTVDIPAGATRTVTLSLRLAPRPPGDYHLVVSPAPRVRPTTFTVDLTTGAEPVRGTVVLDRTWSFGAGEAPVAVVPPVYR